MAQPILRNSDVRGFTLTEMAIVMGIIGIILSAIWIAATAVYGNNQVKKAREETLTIINNWHGIYGSRKVDIAGTATDMTQLTVNNGFAQPDMIFASGVGACVAGAAAASCYINGPWTGSQVNVQAFQTNNAIAVVYANLSRAACEQFASTLTNTPGLLQTTINTTVTQYPPLGTAAALTLSQINTQCNGAGTTNSVLAMFSMN